MGYREQIECPHCHKTIELEVGIKYGGYDNIYAIINPIEPRKGVIGCPEDRNETHWDRLELERRLDK